MMVGCEATNAPVCDVLRAATPQAPSQSPSVLASGLRLPGLRSLWPEEV